MFHNPSYANQFFVVNVKWLDLSRSIMSVRRTPPLLIEVSPHSLVAGVAERAQDTSETPLDNRHEVAGANGLTVTITFYARHLTLGEIVDRAGRRAAH